jgi:hypothetical protein
MMNTPSDGSRVARSKTPQYVILLILSLLVALARFALDLLAQISGKPPEAQNTMDIILILALALALGYQERKVSAESNVASDRPGYSKSFLLIVVLFGVALGLTIPAIASFLLRSS